MKVIVNRNALLEVLNVASGIVANRTTKEILKCVRLTTAGDALLVSATDLEVGLRAEIQQADVQKNGDLLAPAEKVLQIARESLDETLIIEGEEGTCHIRGQDSHYEMYAQDPREFPPVPDLEGEPDMEVEAEVLRALIDRTAFAAAKENTRYAINGVLWEKQPKRLRLVATDGRRLAQAVGPLVKSAGGAGRPIVPARTVQTVQRVLSADGGNVLVRFTANQVLLRAGCFVVSSALVEGHFPNYEEVVPKDNEIKIDLDTEEFLSAVRRASLLSNDKSKGIRLVFAEGKLVLSSRAPEQGEATVAMPIQYAGPALQIGFNPGYLVEALRVVGTPSVQLELKEANRPGLMRAGADFLYVIMPVSLS